MFGVAGTELREVMAFCQAGTAALWSSQHSPLVACPGHGALQGLLYTCGDLVPIAPDPTHAPSASLTQLWGLGCPGDSPAQESPGAPHWSWRALLLIVPAPELLTPVHE